MKVKLAEKAGFCFGVKRAVNILEKTSEKGIKAHTLGPIIHNKQMVKKLAEKGIKPIEDLSEAEEKNIIIRAHGIPPEKESEIKERGFEIVEDGTCPFVKNAQNYAKKLREEGYKVIVIGEKEHPEVKALKAYGDTKSVLENPEEVSNLGELDKVGVVVQTTQSKKRVKEIVSELVEKASETRIYNTRCSATEERQNAAKKLAKEVGAMVVVGGYHSGNTARLAEICSKIVPTHHIETKDDLEEEWFKGMEKVGVTAGASTPKFLINGVIERLEEI